MSAQYIKTEHYVDSNLSVLKIIIENELSLNNVEQVKKDLELLLPENESFHIVIQNMETLDLAGMQLLFAFEKSAKNTNKSFKIDFFIKEELKKILKNSGFAYFLENYKSQN